MAGTVFLSCGQNDRELAIAETIASLLQAPPFGLNVFVARSTNNLYSLNNDVLLLRRFLMATTSTIAPICR